MAPPKTSQIEHAFPSERVLDLFAVPDDLHPLPGGQGQSVLAGDLVLSPGRDREIADQLNPRLARMAVGLDTRRRRDVRIAMPIPARDGTWVVDGWSASRYEPGSRICTDAAVVRATGALLHAEFAQAVTEWPLVSGPPRSRWDRAERIAFGDRALDAGEFTDAQTAFAQELLDRCTTETFGDDQLVHGDLSGNVLLDAVDVPVVIDVAPYWRPARWADAVCVLDLVLWSGADPALLADWSGGSLQALLRAALFRVLSDIEPDSDHVDRYRTALAPLF